MTEVANVQNAANESQTQFALQRIYVRDLSFEATKSPEIFRKQWRPTIEIEINTQHRLLEENFYEVILKLSATIKNTDEIAFIAEIQQAGIFMIAGLEGGQLGHALGAFCPNLLFPYARETLDSLVVRGSFPALMLAPINFDALYAQQLKNTEPSNKMPA